MGKQSLKRLFPTMAKQPTIYLTDDEYQWCKENGESVSGAIRELINEEREQA